MKVEIFEGCENFKGVEKARTKEGSTKGKKWNKTDGNKLIMGGKRTDQ